MRAAVGICWSVSSLELPNCTVHKSMTIKIHFFALIYCFCLIFVVGGMGGAVSWVLPYQQCILMWVMCVRRKRNKTKLSSAQLSFLSAISPRTNVKDTQGASACARPLRLNGNLFSVFISDFLLLFGSVGLYPNPCPRTAAKSSIKRVWFATVQISLSVQSFSHSSRNTNICFFPKYKSSPKEAETGDTERKVSVSQD